MGGLTVGEINILVKARDDASRHMSKIGQNVRKMAKVVVAAVAVAAVAFAAFALSAVNAASDLDEAVNKASETFGRHVVIVEEFAATSANAFGISERAANDYASQLGVILTASGFAQDAAAGMSVDLVKLSADMASFNNIPIDVALQKIRAGLVGEAEPLRQVGVLLSETAVKTEAYASGIAALDSVLTDAQKVQARYNIIQAQTATQQGDFARTADGLANAQRRVGAIWEDMRAQLGERFLPVAQQVMSTLAEKMPAALDIMERALDRAISTAKREFESWQPVIMETVGALSTARSAAQGFGNWIISNQAALVTAIIAIGFAFAWAMPGSALIAGIGLLITAIALLRADVDKLGESTLRLKIRMLELKETAQDVVLNGLGPLGIVLGLLIDQIDPTEGAIADAEAALAALGREAAANRFGDLISAQAGGAIVTVNQLNQAMLGVIATGDVMAAQQAAFQVSQGLSGMELLRAVERQSKLGAVTTPKINVRDWEAAGDEAADAIEKVLTDRERWEAAGQALADTIASGLRGGTITMTDAMASLFTFMDALPAKFSDIAASVGDVIGAFANAKEAASDLFDEVAERGEVTVQDIAEAVRLGAFEMARDFVAEMEGRSSDIGAAIFQHIQEEAEKAAEEAMDAFVDEAERAGSEIASMFSGISGTISGLVGATSAESAQENILLTRLHLAELLKVQEVLAEQAQVQQEIATLELHISELRRGEAAEVARMTAAIEAQEAVIENISDAIEAQQDVVRATRDAARDAIAEIKDNLKTVQSETRATIKAAETAAREARRRAESIIGDLRSELSRLEADLAAALPEGVRSIRDIMADLARAGPLRQAGLRRELEAAKQANLARQGQIRIEISAQEAAIAAAEALAAAQIAAAEATLAAAEASAESQIAAWEEMISAAEEELENLRDSLDEAKDGLGDLREALDDYRDAVDAQVALIEEQITALEEHETVAARELQAIRDAISELELLDEIRRLERDMIAAQALAKNDQLLTDAEVLKAIWDQGEAYGELTSQMAILQDGTIDARDSLVLLQLGMFGLAQTVMNLITTMGSVPGNIPIPSFHGGGIVPGPLGVERLVKAKGGEPILTPEQFASLINGKGQNVVVNVYPRVIEIHGDVNEALVGLGARWAQGVT